MKMSTIKPVDLFRAARNAESSGSPNGTEEVKELRQIKSELKVANDLKSIDIEEATKLTKSPYLEDQSFFKKEQIYNTEKETDWKHVRTEEENRREALVYKTLRRLNIL